MRQKKMYADFFAGKTAVRCALLLIVCCLFAGRNAQAQYAYYVESVEFRQKPTLPSLAVKTNLLYWATATFNIGVEVGLSPKTTLGLTGGYNPFTFNDNRKWKHYLVQPEVRYWFCRRFKGWFLGVQAGYLNYNISHVDYPLVSDNTKPWRYEGWAMGAGLTAGYVFDLSRRWGLELSLGGGYVWTKYDRYDYRKCGAFREHKSDDFFSPTNLAVSFIYNIY